MSRPPRPHFAVSTSGEQPGRTDRVDYLPSELGNLLALQRDLAASELDRTATREEGDFAYTLMELSALVGHILGVYQDRNASEAWLSTATAPSSLVRHARRLAYIPDSGLAATGHVVLFAKEGLRGVVAAGLGLASVARGEVEAQDYETLDDLLVDDALDEMIPARATVPVTVASTDTMLVLEGLGHRIEPGETVALVGPPGWWGFTVLGVEEDERAETTTLHLDRSVGTGFTPGDAVVRVLAHPRRVLRSFGWAADANLYPAARLKHANATKPKSSRAYWYEVAIDGRAQYRPTDIYLSTLVDGPLLGRFVVRRGGVASVTVFRIEAEVTATVLFHRQQTQTHQTFTTKTSEIAGVHHTALEAKDTKVAVQSHISATVTAIEVKGHDGAPVDRSKQPMPSTWLTDWATEARVKARRPNHAKLEGTATHAPRLELLGRLVSITPGRVLLFSNLAEDQTQRVRVTAVLLPPAPHEGEALPADAVTEIQWEALTEGPAGGWYLDDLKIFGNVARVSHGRTLSKVLGGSDGVTPLLRFVLEQAPVTMLPSAHGGEPAIAVRINDVAWTRVTDFWDSGPDDRHYRLEIDEEQQTTVVFGDGRNGAIPPAGAKHIATTYRVGLGTDGNASIGRLSRMKKAHPLLDRAFNLTPISGGAEPAEAKSVRTQATRYIRTFDRAVSVQDHADLALLYPGVARAAARWDAVRGGVELVVATAQGRAPRAMDELRAYLQARRDATVPLVLRGPSGRAVFVSVGVAANPAYLREVVRNNVRAALHGDDDARSLFSFAARELGQPAFLSEVYAAVEAAEGVLHCRVTRFAANPSITTVADVVVVEPHEWLHLAANHLVVNLLSEAR